MLSDKGLNIEAAIPGLSFTPINVIFASFLVEDTPVIILLFKIFLRLVINVPLLFLNDDLTSTSILLSLDSWTDEDCMTLEPKDDISSISS